MLSLLLSIIHAIIGITIFISAWLPIPKIQDGLFLVSASLRVPPYLKIRDYTIV